MKRLMGMGLIVAVAVFVAGCGSSGSGTGTTSGSSTTISSLADVPSVDSMVSGGATSTSLSASMLKAVSAGGSAPLLTTITPTIAATNFWKSETSPNGNLIADINADNSIAAANSNAFWLGEGSCRMAQMVGYAMQNIKQAGISTCYMKGMPNAVGLAGLTTASGSTEITTPSNLFNKQTGDIIVRVNATGAPAEGGETGDMNVFIKVYGSSNASLTNANDYWVDLWFCADTSSSANGYEQIRYSGSAGTLTQTTLDTGFGTFSSTFSANITADASGNPIFDSASDRSATNTFSGSFGGTDFVQRSQVSVSGTQLAAKEYWIDSTSVRKNYAIAQYSGDTMAALRFLQAGYKGSDNSGGGDFTYEGATEFQTDHYEGLGTITDLSDTDIGTAVNDYVFATDTFFDSAPSTPGTTTLADYNCNPTVNYTVAMDFTDAAVQAVASGCENDFQDMNFCDDPTTIGAARNVVFVTEFAEF